MDDLNAAREEREMTMDTDAGFDPKKAFRMKDGRGVQRAHVGGLIYGFSKGYGRAYWSRETGKYQLAKEGFDLANVDPRQDPGETV